MKKRTKVLWGVCVLLGPAILFLYILFSHQFGLYEINSDDLFWNLSSYQGDDVAVYFKKPEGFFVEQLSSENLLMSSTDSLGNGGVISITTASSADQESSKDPLYSSDVVSRRKVHFGEYDMDEIGLRVHNSSVDLNQIYFIEVNTHLFVGIHVFGNNIKFATLETFLNSIKISLPVSITLPRPLKNVRIVHSDEYEPSVVLYVQDGQLYMAKLCNPKLIKGGHVAYPYLAENGFFVLEKSMGGQKETASFAYSLAGTILSDVDDPQTVKTLSVSHSGSNYSIFIADSKSVYRILATSTQRSDLCTSLNIDVKKINQMDSRSLSSVATLYTGSGVFYVSKDDGYVYLNDVAVSVSDSKTFYQITGSDQFFADKHRVYVFDYMQHKLIQLDIVGDDMAPMQPNISDIKLTDFSPNVLSDGLYYYNYSTTGSEQGLLVASPIVQGLARIINYSGYTTNGSSVYFGKTKRVVGADPVSFAIITEPYPGYLIKGDSVGGYDYAKDKRAVYYLGSEVLSADPDTFVPIAMGEGGHHWFGKDAKNVFIGEKKITGADPKTFEILWYPIYEGCGPGFFSKDAVHVFYENKIISGADPDTFEIVKGVSGALGHDKNGYYDGTQYLGPTYDEKKYECNYG